jgi:hypothetical protein
MTTKQKLYDIALGTYVGTQKVSLAENVGSRNALDAVYDSALLYMLEQGLWKFALRTVNLTPLRSAAAAHRQYAYPLPEDFVRLARISPTQRLGLNDQLEDYVEENGFWLTDVNTLWVQYVSSDPDYGLNLDLYPANYEQAVASWLAYQSTLSINKDRGDRSDLLKLHNLTLSNSRRLDAVDEAVKQKPAGRWPRARGWGFSGTSRGLR